MVWIPEPQRRSVTPTQRRKMERMFPCTKRVISMLEGIGTAINNNGYVNQSILII